MERILSGKSSFAAAERRKASVACFSGLLIIQSFTNHLYENPFSSFTIEFSIKNLLPGTEMDTSIGDGYHYFSPHNLSFVVSVSIIFTRTVVIIPVYWCVGCQFLKPLFVIPMESRFVIIDKDRRSNVHSIHQTESLLNTAFKNYLCHFGVIFTKSIRVGIFIQSSFVYDFIIPPILLNSFKK